MSKLDKNRNSSTMEIRLSMQKALKANLSEQARTGLLERRSGKDRRSWGKMPEVPFHDSNGSIVTSDRRVTPERRMSSLQVNWDNSVSSTSAPVSLIQNENEVPPAIPAAVLPEDGIAAADSDLQKELDALAGNVDDMLGLEATDLMDDSGLDYSKPKNGKTRR
jgi:hypothetical protein